MADPNGYKYQVLCGLESVGGAEPGDSYPHFAGLGVFTAKTPDAACLAAAESAKVTGSLIAIPVRNWHGRSIIPTQGFAIEGEINVDPVETPRTGTVTVVVSGAGQEIDLDGCEDLIDDALAAAGIVPSEHVPKSCWDLRTEAGAVIAPEDVEAGGTYFLDPDAGGEPTVEIPVQGGEKIEEPPARFETPGGEEL